MADVVQRIPNAVGQEVKNIYDFSVGAGDIIIAGVGRGSRKWTTVSVSPLSSGKTTRISTKNRFKVPVSVYFEPSVSSRYRGDYATAYLGSYDQERLVPSIETYTGVSASQSGTTLTLTSPKPFDGGVGSWVSLSGFPDNRLNYFNLCIAGVSADKKTLTATTFDETTLPSLTASSSGGTMQRVEFCNFSNHAYGFRTSGTSATANAILSRYAGEDSVYTSGTLAGSQSLTTASTALSAVFTGATGQYSFQATSRFIFEISARQAFLGGKSINSSASFSASATITDVKPDDEKEYKFFFDVVTPISQPIPVAKIVSATKAAASTEVTLVTDVPHGLAASTFVQVYGVRDQAAASYPSHTVPTAVASIVNATTFKIAMGSAGSPATSYGGGVTLCNGGQTQQGLIGQTIQSVARDADGYVTLLGTATWSGIIVGGTVQLYGVRSAADGSDLGVDGAYRVNTLSTTTLILEPLYDFNGELVSPAGGVINTTNCGGAVIDRVEYRLHDISLDEYKEDRIIIDGQGCSDPARALPALVLNSVAVNTTETTLLAPATTSSVSTASTNATIVKTTAGNLYALTAFNPTAATVYLKLYNKASAPTVGTDVPLTTYPIPSGQHLPPPPLGRLGQRFSSGIAWAMTAGMAATDTATVGAGVQVSLTYV